MVAPARRARAVPCPGVVAGRGLAGHGTRAACLARPAGVPSPRPAPGLGPVPAMARGHGAPARARPPAPACPARVVTAPARPRARPSVPMARGLELGQRAAPTCAWLVRSACVRPYARCSHGARGALARLAVPLSTPRRACLPPPVYFMRANHVVHVNEIENSIWKLVTLVNSYS
jgi:hypothetical protein